MERLQTGQDRSSTSKVIRLNTVPAGQRYAMVMPSYFSRLSMLNAKKPSPHHHDMQGKTILAFRRIVQKIREGREGTTGGWLECPLAVTTLALHLDDLELHAIRTLKEADPPTIARDHLL